MLHALIAFAAGAFIECAFVLWFKSANAGGATKTALLSMAIGAAQVTGVVEVISHGNALSLILGYGAGAYAVVKYSAAHAKSNGK